MKVDIRLDDDKIYKTYKADIDKLILKLKARLEEYGKQGIAVSKIFNDSRTMCDIINKHYYVFKGKVRNIQVRILYTVKGETIIIYDVFIKNRITNSVSNEYLRVFEDRVNRIA